MCITVKQMMQIEENGHQMGFLRKFMMENAGAATAKRAPASGGRKMTCRWSPSRARPTREKLEAWLWRFAGSTKTTSRLKYSALMTRATWKIYPRSALR